MAIAIFYLVLLDYANGFEMYNNKSASDSQRELK